MSKPGHPDPPSPTWPAWPCIATASSIGLFANTIPRADIEALETSAVSLMPENLLKPLSPQELRDLFSYLESPGTLAP